MTHTYRIQTLDQAETTAQLQRYLDDAASQDEELVAVSPKFFVFRQEVKTPKVKALSPAKLRNG